MRNRRLSLFALLVVFGCGNDDPVAPGTGIPGQTPDETENTPPPTSLAMYTLPADLAELDGETFLDHPWPSDLRLRPDGTVRFEGYPNPSGVPVIASYIESMKGKVSGFSPVASGFLRFTAPIDPATLPQTPLEARDESSSVQLINVDEDSANLGERMRITLHWQRDKGHFWSENTLSFMPTFGFPLDPGTTYALVVTGDLRAEDGGSVGPSDELKQIIEDPTALADSMSSALQGVLAAGISAEDIVHLTTFTTNRPTEAAEKIRDWTLSNFEAPTAWEWTTATGGNANMEIYEGMYGPSPDFQEGELPFVKYGDGGGFVFDEDGEPVLQREFDLRFALSVPKADVCPMPEEGYPIVLYAHGTGGNYRSFLRGIAEGNALAKKCVAAMGIDQIFHGTRPGSDSNASVELLFFNIQNPEAARANGPQSAIDVVQQGRLFTETGIRVPADISRTGEEILFDGDKVMFFGHSQGGLNGPMFLAIDDQARGAALSGSGSLISITLLEKTAPVNVASLVEALVLGGNVGIEQLSSFHPAISLAQTLVDPTDPIHYVPQIINTPRDGFRPKSMLMTEGINANGSGDSYTPPHGTEVQAVAMGIPVQEPVIHPIAEYEWADLVPTKIPAEGLSGNVGGGEASGILAQWEASRASDGHFVIYAIPEAMEQAAQFLRNLADDPKGRIPAP